MVAANKGNPSRKAFDSQFAGFAQFAKAHPDAVLYCHSAKAEHGENCGVNLPELAAYHGLIDGTNILFPDAYRNIIGFDDAYMRAVYSAADVTLMATMGEGFGIPIVEAQACGSPVIVGDWTANAELCFSGWKIDKPKAVPMWTALGTYQYHVMPGAVSDALEKAHTMRGNQDYRNRARKGALQYDADKVTEKYWKPYLEKLEAELRAAKDE
jgi:glycosyltransferase involved in cell wall biosynthesis